MNGRLKVIGVMLAVVGLAFIAGGGFAFYKTNQGAQALQAFSVAQNVKLNYNDSGPARRPRRDRWSREDHVAPRERLGLRGRQGRARTRMTRSSTRPASTCTRWPRSPTTPSTARRPSRSPRMSSSTEWSRPGGRHVRLPERRQVLDRLRPDRPDPGCGSRKIWTGTAHALIAELGVGSVTASALTMGLGMAALLAGFGGTLLLTGLGLVWATRAETEKSKVAVLRPAGSIA